jgi:hypothetical protein
MISARLPQTPYKMKLNGQAHALAILPIVPIKYKAASVGNPTLVTHPLTWVNILVKVIIPHKINTEKRYFHPTVGLSDQTAWTTWNLLKPANAADTAWLTSIS